MPLNSSHATGSGSEISKPPVPSLKYIYVMYNWKDYDRGGNL